MPCGPRGWVLALTAVIVSVMCGCEGPPSDFPAYVPPPGVGSVDPADFLGAAACGECHRDQYERWATSTHGRAGGAPEPDRVLPAFDGRPIRFADATVTPTRMTGGQYAFVVEWSEGVDTLVVDGVVGGGHMVGGGTQGFFTRHPDGTRRFVPFDWSRTEGVWFCNTRYPDPGTWHRITPDMPLERCADWPPRRVLGQVMGATNCDTCHGSQIVTTFDPGERAFTTRFTGLEINCESCHGPGRRHAELVRTGGVTAGADLGLTDLATLSEDASLETCFRCHATRLVLHPGDLPGEPLEANASLLLPLLTDRPFLPDNRVGTFGYQLNHRGSDCYLDGTMTCTSCHEPHAQTYQDEFAGTLPGRFDDGQCLACHGSKAGDPRSHTFHPQDSEGSRCVSCHMPYLQHRSIGDDIRYARSDHTIPIPRPGLDERLGVTSACAGCHPDRSPDDLARQVADWYGQLKPWRPLVQGIAQAGSVSDPGAAAELLLRPGEGFAMSQASGASQFLLRFIRPDHGPDSPTVVDRLRSLTDDPDLDVRALALASLHLGWGADPEVRALLEQRAIAAGEDQGRLLDRWSAVLRYVGDAYRFRGAAADAIVAYGRALEVVPEDPVTLEALGLARLVAGAPGDAETAFHASIRADSTRSGPLLGLAQALADQGRGPEAAVVLEEAVTRFPLDPRARFELGNHYLAGQDLVRAGQAFGRAIELDLGLAAARLGLAQVLAARGDLAAARHQVELALEFAPGNPQARRLLQRLGGS